jgi:hypothetical protein
MPASSHFGRRQDQLVPCLHHEFRALGKVVAQALHADDRAFFDGLLREGADFLGPNQVKRLWTTLRRSLPKFKSRKAHLPGGKLVHLESQWTPYLADLEAGSITSPDLLLTECAERQDSWIATAPRHLELGMLQEAKKEKEKVSQKGKENWTKTTSPSQKEKENNLRMVASTVERQDIANQECWQKQQDEAKGVRQVKAPASSPRPQQDPQLHK